MSPTNSKATDFSTEARSSLAPEMKCLLSSALEMKQVTNRNDRQNKQNVVGSQQIELTTTKIKEDVDLEGESDARGRDKTDFRSNDSDIDEYRSLAKMKKKRKS